MTVLFRDATAVVIDYLETALAAAGQAAPVMKDIPDPRPSKFVTVLRTGGPRKDIVTDGAQLSIESWAATAAAAWDQAAWCRKLMFDLRGTVQAGAPVYRVEELAGPVDLPDPLSNQPRVTFTHIVAVRGA